MISNNENGHSSQKFNEECDNPHERHNYQSTEIVGKTNKEWYLKIFAALIAILIGIILIVISPYGISLIDVKWDVPISQLGLALIISGITYLTFQYVFDKGNREFTKTTVNNAVEKIEGTISLVEKQLEDLTEHNKILHGAVGNGIIQIYKKRSEAMQDILNDIGCSKQIKIQGISLREYFNPAEGKSFVKMESILDDISHNDDRKIQILIINPNCEQATIRAEREADEDFSADNPYEESGLYSDVWHTIRYLSRKLHKDRVEAKTYSSSPSCFLVITDKYTYVEQYHYGVKRSGLVGGNFPVFKVRTTTMPGNKLDEATISEHLIGHFSYVWDGVGRRSQELDYITKEHNIGTSTNAWICSIRNIFQNRAEAKERINILLGDESNNKSNTKEVNESREIKLIGISLRDFFHAGSEYYRILRDISSSEDGKSATIKALILDPLSEQGTLRSEREEPGIKRGNLFSEVVTSLRSIDRLNGVKNVIDARLYRASPSCFAILVDNGMLLEQYHYGSSAPDATILGGKIPLLEYGNDSSTYHEIQGHFNYIWDSDTTISIEDWRQINVQTENIESVDDCVVTQVEPPDKNH